MNIVIATLLLIMIFVSFNPFKDKKDIPEHPEEDDHKPTSNAPQFGSGYSGTFMTGSTSVTAGVLPGAAMGNNQDKIFYKVIKFEDYQSSTSSEEEHKGV